MRQTLTWPVLALILSVSACITYNYVTTSQMPLLALSLLILVVIRQVQGPSEPVHTMAALLSRNTNRWQLMYATIHLFLFLGAGWVLVAFGFRSADRFLRQELMLVPLYVIPILLFGVWKEVRLLLPLYPVFLLVLLFPVGAHLAEPPSRASVRR